jgi:hypothetical protein
MASIARLRASNHVLRTVSTSVHVQLSLLPLYQLQGLRRSIHTSADTTTLQEDVKESEPFTVKLHEDSFRSRDCPLPDLDVQITKPELLQMYREMQTMRRMEMAADALYKAKMIRGFCHLAIGQVSVVSHVALHSLTMCGIIGSCICWYGTWYYQG